MSTITMRRGSEGPQHDPYGYEEITVERADKRVTLHEGLGTWIEIDMPAGSGLSAVKRRYEYGEETCHILFEYWAGITVKAATRAYEFKRYVLPLRRHNAKCPSRQFEHHQGFPGESFTCCAKCGEPVSYNFDISAVE